MLAVENMVIEIASESGPLRAVDGVSLEVREGEILGLVGESGAGKSILGSAILGLLEPPCRLVGGEIRFSGCRIDQLGDNEMQQLRGRHIAAVFQDPLTSLNPLLTVEHHLVQTIQTHLDLSAAQARERAILLLSSVGIPAPEERLRAYPHELSGGMRQRVVLALAFSCYPRLIVADEPTSALDVSLQSQLIGVLRTMCRETGTSVLLVSHDMGVIAQAADRVAVMYAGRIVEIGETEAVLWRPKHPYTQGLISAIPAMGDDLDVLPQIPGSMPPLSDIPAGCSFNPRCDRRFARCLDAKPDLVPVDKGLAACWALVG